MIDPRPAKARREGSAVEDIEAALGAIATGRLVA